MPRIATLSAAYSANKGAASMIQALIDNLPARIGPTRIVAVSTHPTGDRCIYPRIGAEVEVVPQRPIEMTLVQFPLALLAGLLRIARLPWRWVCRPTTLREIARVDVVADLSGVSFFDSRRLAVPMLIYNALAMAIPLLLGRPVVKCAQAMGPFETRFNRRLAKLVLPHLRVICPRGATTEQSLRKLGLTNLMPAGDLAFAMQLPGAVRERMRARLAEASPGPYLVVAPSQLVDTYCRGRGIDYPTIIAEFIDSATKETGHTIVIVAYAAQPDAGANRLNDLPLCRKIAGQLRSTERVAFFDEDLLPTELRAVIGEAELLVTSRFHAMIAGLSERTPPLVIGWSHKYAEILEPFGLEDLALTYDDLGSGNEILTRARELLERGGELRDAIGGYLPRARAEAEINFQALGRGLDGNGCPLRSTDHPDAAKALRP